MRPGRWPIQARCWLEWGVAGTLNYTDDAAGDLLTLASSNANGASDTLCPAKMKDGGELTLNSSQSVQLRSGIDPIHNGVDDSLV